MLFLTHPMGFCNSKRSVGSLFEALEVLILGHLICRRNIGLFGEKPLWRQDIAGQGTQLEAVRRFPMGRLPAFGNAERQGAAYARRMAVRRRVLIGFDDGVVIGALVWRYGVHLGVAHGRRTLDQPFAADGARVFVEVLDVARRTGEGGVQGAADGVLISGARCCRGGSGVARRGGCRGLGRRVRR